MKKQKRFLTWISGALLMLFSISSWATNPTYTMRITNAAQVSCNVWEFDVNMTRGAVALNLAQWQLAIAMNPAIIPSGGVINVAPVPGSSSQLNVNAQPTPDLFSYIPTGNLIQVTPVSPTSTNYTTLPAAGTYIRLARIRVACSLPFVTGTTPNPAWNFSLPLGYATKIFALVSGTNVDITTPASHTLFGTTNPTFAALPDPLTQNVTIDATSYCNNPGSGSLLGLENTQAGYTYYMYRNGVAVSGIGGVIFGDGTGAATFGTLATGDGAIYTVKSPSCTGQIDMTGSYTLSVFSPVVASVSIAPTTGGFMATPVNGGETPYYQWYVNGVIDDFSGFGNDAFYPYLPVDGDFFYCTMITSETCVTPETALATSNTINWPIVIAPVVFNVTGGGTVCAGEPLPHVFLSGSEAAFSYQLYNGLATVGAEVPGDGSALDFGPLDAGSYTVKAGAFAMNGSASIIVNPIPATPTVTANGPTTFCTGGSVILTSSAAGSYLWSTGATTPSITVTTTGSYSVTVTNAGCASEPSLAMPVTVNPIPATPTISANGPTAFCAGGSVILTSSAGGSYLWNTGATTQAITVTTAGSYNVKVSNGGCTSAQSNSVSVTVNAIPSTPTISANGPTSFCSGGSVTLTSSAGARWLWSTGATTQAITVSASGSYTVAITNNGCSSLPSVPVVVSVSAIVTPSVSIAATPGTSVATGTQVTFTPTPVNGGTTPTYQWFKNSLPVSTDDTYSYVPNNNDLIQVTMTSSLYCVTISSAESNSIVMTVSPVSSTWIGVDNDWNNSANWSDGVPGSVTNVVINKVASGNYPILTAGTLPVAACHNMTITDGAILGTEFLTGIVNNGAVVKRTLVTNAAHFLSSGVTNPVLTWGNVFTAPYNTTWVRTYNTTTNGWNNISGLTNVVNFGMGYSVNTTTPVKVATFTGNFFHSPGGFTAPLTYVSPTQNYTMVGNPYPCAIDWDNIIPQTNIGATVYVWNGTAGNYSKWNGVAGGLTDGIIPAETGFIVTSATSGVSLNIPLTARVPGGNYFYKQSVSNLLELRADGNNYYDQTYILFNNDATSAFEAQYDARKMWGLDEAPQLYSMITNEVLSINELPLAGNEVVDLGFKCSVSGEYTLSAAGMESFDVSTPILLEDLVLNKTQDMRENSNYSFSYVAGENENRFKLHFKYAEGITDMNNNGIVVYSLDHSVVINNTTQLAGEVSVYDMTGRLLSHTNMNGQMKTSIPMQVAIGTYMVKVVTSKATVNQKVFIR
jgi:hypothetical protein